MSLKILYTVLGYKPAYRIGGPIVSVSSLAEALVRKGHEVTVLTTNSNLDQDLDVPLNQPIDVDGVTVYYFRRKEFLKKWLPFIPYLAKSSGFAYAPEMAKYLDQLVPQMDLVHTHLPFIYPTKAAAKSAFKHEKALFYHQRGDFDPNRLKFRGFKKRAYIRLVERPIMDRASALIALTEAEVDSYRALGVRTRCHIIPNGIDVTAYRQAHNPDSPVLRDIPPDAQVILFLGRLHPIKGADRLLDAFLRIHSRVPRAMLVMAGPDEWGLQSKFKEAVDRAGAADRVRFPGMVTGDVKRDLLARADLFCLPSEAEGFSMAVLESLASSTAVLLSPGCHFPLVESAGAGLICRADSISLAESIIDLLSDSRRLKLMGEAGYDLVHGHFTWDRIADQMVSAYRAGLSSVISSVPDAIYQSTIG